LFTRVASSDCLVFSLVYAGFTNTAHPRQQLERPTLSIVRPKATKKLSASGGKTSLTRGAAPEPRWALPQDVYY